MIPAPQLAVVRHEYTEGKRAEGLLKAQQGARHAEELWRWYLPGMRARGYVMIWETKPTLAYMQDRWTKEAMRAAQAAADDGFIPTKWMLWGGDGGGDAAGGRSMLNAEFAVTYANSPLDVLRHEFGHQLGFNHAAVIELDGHYVEYGAGDWSIMGGGTNRPGPGAARLVLGGMLDPIEVTGAGEWPLGTVEADEMSMHAGMGRAIRLPGGQILSHRKEFGDQRAINGGRRLLVNTLMPPSDGHSVLHLPPMPVGTIREFPECQVEYAAWEDEVALVRVAA